MHAPYIAFSVTNDGTLVVSTLSDMRIATGEPLDLPIDLGQLNDDGYDTAAGYLGRYVLGYLNLCHPNLLRNQYPNLYVDLKADFPLDLLPPMAPGSSHPTELHADHDAGNTN
jgi:hypothetical protein